MEERTYHFIWIKQIQPNGDIYYSKFECFNVDFYIRIMTDEFLKKWRG